MKKKKNKDKHKIIIISLVIVILILVSFITIKKLGRIGLVVTGYVDVFDAMCSPGNEFDCHLTDQDGNTVGGIVDAFVIEDKDYIWDSLRQLNIFNMPFYENNKKIAPGSFNAYEFVINNGYNFKIKYDLSFIEDNIYDINMKFKLKRNGEYILGSIDNYETLDSLSSLNYELDRKTHDTYLLEWKWVDNANDTSIGILDEAKYGLKINIVSSSIED